MRRLFTALTVILLVAVIGVVRAQNAKTNYQPGDFQTANPNYPRPNPFYFEGKIDWNLLKISQPSNAWEYLQEGIHLRAMGQKDPLVEWQREGFDMFGQMMHGIAQDFVRYVMHVQVVAQEPSPPPEVQNVQYSAPDDSASGGGMLAAAAAAAASDDGEATAPAEAPTMQPIVRTEWEKTPRNAPCPCGSGKKYKLCHGK